MRNLLRAVKELTQEASAAGDTPYRRGYLDALRYIEEMIEEILWENGEDEEGSS